MPGDLRSGHTSGDAYDPLGNSSQQASLSVHRARQGFVKARAAQANQIRSLLAEFGITIPQGISHLYTRMPEVIEDGGNDLPSALGSLSRAWVSITFR